MARQMEVQMKSKTFEPADQIKIFRRLNILSTVMESTKKWWVSCYSSLFVDRRKQSYMKSWWQTFPGWIYRRLWTEMEKYCSIRGILPNFSSIENDLNGLKRLLPYCISKNIRKSLSKKDKLKNDFINTAGITECKRRDSSESSAMEHSRREIFTDPTTQTRSQIVDWKTY